MDGARIVKKLLEDEPGGRWGTRVLNRTEWAVLK
jgi:hypothetical protein